MQRFISFITKETRHILRDPRTMLILFGMPIAMMLIFGFAISTDVKNVRTVVVTSSIDHETQQAITRLGANEYFDITYKVQTPAEAEQLIRSQKADMAVVFGSDYAAKHTAMQIITDGADPNMAQMYSRYASEELRTKSEKSLPNGNSSLFTLRSSLLFNPQMRSCYNFVPGIMGMLLMLICAMMTSISIVREKERGTMEVLLVSPVRPLMIIIAKVIPYLVLAFCILGFILGISHFVLDVPIAGSIGWIFLVSGIYITVALSLGILISTIAETQLVALLASAMMLILPCILLSGMMFPIESMPKILQYISAIMPPRYYISAIRKLMIMGVSINNVAQEMTVLACMAAALLTAALLKFKNRLQ